MTTPEKSSSHPLGHGPRRDATVSVLAVAVASSATGAVVVSATSSAAPQSVTLQKVAQATTTTPADPTMAHEQGFVRGREVVQPSVVEIMTTAGLGLDVVFDAKGGIVTNAHVVGDATSFAVLFSDGNRAKETLVGTYAPDDLAVVRVSPPKGIRPAHFASSSALQVGDIVLAMGNPLRARELGDGGHRELQRPGSERRERHRPPRSRETSAAINPGNSGGALVDLSGQEVEIPPWARPSRQRGRRTCRAGSTPETRPQARPGGGLVSRWVGFTMSRLGCHRGGGR